MFSVGKLRFECINSNTELVTGKIFLSRSLTSTATSSDIALTSFSCLPNDRVCGWDSMRLGGEWSWVLFRSKVENSSAEFKTKKFSRISLSRGSYRCVSKNSVRKICARYPRPTVKFPSCRSYHAPSSHDLCPDYWLSNTRLIKSWLSESWLGES